MEKPRSLPTEKKQGGRPHLSIKFILERGPENQQPDGMLTKLPNWSSKTRKNKAPKSKIQNTLRVRVREPMVTVYPTEVEGNVSSESGEKNGGEGRKKGNHGTPT